MRNLILIAGAGRNVGKTTLSCLIIGQLKALHQLTAVKVSSHHHKITEKQKVIYELEGLTISEEQDRQSTKDSSRYLRAGAKRSLFVRVNDEKMPELVTWLKKHIDGIMVCESGTLGQFVRPAKAIFVNSKNPVKHPEWDFDFETTIFDKKLFKPGLDELFKGKLKTQNDGI